MAVIVRTTIIIVGSGCGAYFGGKFAYKHLIELRAADREKKKR